MKKTNYVEAIENEKVWKSYLERLKSKPEYKRLSPDMKISYNILMENTRRQLLREQTTSYNLSPVVQTVLGLVKRLFPKLIAPELVSVQPLKSVRGTVKYLKAYYYDENNNKIELPNLGQGVPSATLSKPKVQGQVNTQIASGGTSVVADLSNISGNLSQGSITVAVDGLGTATDDGKGHLVGEQVAGFIDYTNKKVTVVVKDQVSANTNVTVAQFTDDFEMNRKLTRIFFSVSNEELEQKYRKLDATWTYEAEDYQATDEFGLNMKDVVFDTTTNIISSEINAEIIGDLLSGADTTQTWDYQNPAGGVSNLQFRDTESFFRSLTYVINTVSQKMATKIKQSAPNYIVVSPAMQSLIVDGFNTVNNSGTKLNDDFGLGGYTYAGTLLNKYNMYVTPSISDNQILVGYKGKTLVESGYVYSPFVPITAKPLTYETVPGLLLMTAYQKKMYMPFYYGAITVNNF